MLKVYGAIGTADGGRVLVFSEDMYFGSFEPAEAKKLAEDLLKAVQLVQAAGDVVNAYEKATLESQLALPLEQK